MTIEARLRLTRGGFTLDAEFEAPAGGVTAIFGPSGCGKTTLLRTIAGLERRCQGFLAVGSRVWQDADRFLPAHQRPVGYVFQEASLFSHLDVCRNLDYGYRRVPTSERRVEMDQAIDLLGLERLLDRTTADLSGGERQRVAIARALLTSPRLLLLDEPLTGLDRETKTEIVPYLQRLHEQLEIPVLYVSHSHDEVARIADHLVLMESGRVLAAGPCGEMLTRLDLPALRGDDAEAILEATVESRDDAYQLTRLAYTGGSLLVAGTDLPVGQVVRLRVLARDVSLTLEHQTATSILNILPVTVEALAEESPAQILVRLSSGDAALLSRVTRKSADALGLEPGKRLHAQIKTVAILT